MGQEQEERVIRAGDRIDTLVNLDVPARSAYSLALYPHPLPFSVNIVYDVLNDIKPNKFAKG